MFFDFFDGRFITIQDIVKVEEMSDRSGYFLYIVLFVISVSTISIYQMYDNVSTDYRLTVNFQAHTCTMSSTNFYHSYETIIIDVFVTTSNYDVILSRLSVGGFPFWIDTSQWEAGNTVNIGMYSYELSRLGDKWKAHRDIDDEKYENLYYYRDFGIFAESYTDRATLDLYGFSGYTKEIRVDQSNLLGFIAKVTGSNVLVNGGLVSGIFIELAGIQLLIQRRKNKSKKETTKSTTNIASE